MKIIADVNIILAALLKNSTTRRIIIESGFEFYFPETSLHKIRKYKDYIINKSGFSEKDYQTILAKLFKYITIIPTEEITKNWENAKNIMAHIDEEDVVFIASALSITDSKIWSNDDHFTKQKFIKIFTTEELSKALKL